MTHNMQFIGVFRYLLKATFIHGSPSVGGLAVTYSNIYLILSKLKYSIELGILLLEWIIPIITVNMIWCFIKKVVKYVFPNT